MVITQSNESPQWLAREAGRKKLEAVPADWRAHFEFGVVELEQFQNFSEAHRLFARACALNSRAGQAWFYYGLTCFRLGYFEDALRALQRAENSGYLAPAPHETRGDCLYNVFRQTKAKWSAYRHPLPWPTLWNVTL